MFDVKYLDSLDHRLELARQCLRSPNPSKIFEAATKPDSFNTGLLFGYIRSFVRLSHLLDVQKVADELGITRQSVKRHVVELENLLDVQLFGAIGTPSQITAAGLLWLPRAQEILELSQAFLNRAGPSNAQYKSTQLPLRMLLRDERNSTLLRSFAKAWMTGDQNIESGWFRNFDDFCILYEREEGKWISRKIGGRAAFTDWFGTEIAKESEGLPLAEMKTGDDLQEEMTFLLDLVYTRGGMHFSEVAYSSPGLNDDGVRKPLLYQRLLAETFVGPDRPVIASIIQIIGLHQTDPMPG